MCQTCTKLKTSKPSTKLVKLPVWRRTSKSQRWICSSSILVVSEKTFTWSLQCLLLERCSDLAFDSSHRLLLALLLTGSQSGPKRRYSVSAVAKWWLLISTSVKISITVLKFSNQSTCQSLKSQPNSLINSIVKTTWPQHPSSSNLPCTCRF